MGKKHEYSVMPKMLPGPGYYNTNYSTRVQSAVFGQEARVASNRIQKNDIGASYIDIFSEDPIRPKSSSYSFSGKFERQQFSIRSNQCLPGPGYYQLSKPGRHQQGFSFGTTHVNMSLKYKKDNGKCVVKLFDNLYKKPCNSFQKFSNIKRFGTTRDKYRHHKYSRSQNAIIVNTQVETTKEKQKRQIKNKEKLEKQIQAAKIAKESKFFNVIIIK